MKLAMKFRLMAAVVVVPVAIAILALAQGRGSSASVALPEVIELHPSTFAYRANGAFTAEGKVAEAPMTSVTFPRTVAIMKREVTAAEYQRCVDAGACPRTEEETASADLPAVKVNWFDATAYAAWLSRETGVHFRLPSDEEWAYAAASRFADDGIKQSDPGQLRLAAYDFEVNRSASNRAPQPVGSFGVNENGLIDLAGNVWEWTDTCFVRRALGAGGGTVAATTYCGIRIAEGRHRAYMIDFVRDARNGGCSAGAPPTNLGFRLVRDDGSWGGLHALLSRVARYAGLARALEKEASLSIHRALSGTRPSIG
jgi:formylglycine-generating enzyme required for sulfatase activity